MPTHPKVKATGPTRQCRDCPDSLPPGSKKQRCDRCCLTQRRKVRKAAKNRWRKKNPQAALAITSRSKFKHKYGVTVQQAEQVRAEQGGICAMRGCGKPAIRVDHCHETGVFRGWLCHGCNVRLSGIEDSEFLSAAIEYLDQRREGVVPVGLTKHGEGSIIPETEQQKTAAREGSGMSEGAREALRRENEEADGRDLDGK